MLYFPKQSVFLSLKINFVLLHAWWSTISQLATLLSSLIARQWVGLQTL